jgi:hypothetical protein
VTKRSAQGVGRFLFLDSLLPLISAPLQLAVIKFIPQHCGIPTVARKGEYL